MPNPNEVSKQLKLTNPGNIDARRGPYATVATACLAIPNDSLEGRYLREGKFADIGTVTSFVTHHWQGGFTDAHLLPSNKDLIAVVSGAQTTADLGVTKGNAAQVTANTANAKADVAQEDINRIEEEYLPSKLSVVQSKVDYLKLLNLETDGLIPQPIFIFPYNKSAEAFTTGSNLGLTGCYYEVANKITKANKEVLRKVHCYSTGSGTIALMFFRITGGLGFVEQTINKSVVSGWNEFIFTEGDILGSVTNLDVFYVGVTNVTVGLMKFKAAPAGTVSVFGVNSLGGAITTTTNTFGMYIEVQQVNKAVLESYPQIKILTETTATKVSTLEGQVPGKLNISDAKADYLKLLNLNTDGVVTHPILTFPYNKSAETFTTGTNLGLTGCYYEITNKITKALNEKLRKVHLYSTGAGTVALMFFHITEELGFVEYTINKSVAIGWNEFSFADSDVPEHITDLPIYYVGVTNVTVALMKYKATPVGTLSVFGVNSLGGTITNTTSTFGMYVEVQQFTKTTLEYFPETKEKLDNLISFSGKDGLFPVPVKVVNSALYASSSSYLYGWCDEKCYLTPEREFKELIINTAIAGPFNLMIIEVQGENYTIVHSYTGEAVSGVTRISKADLAIPDLSSYKRLYAVLQNTNTAGGSGLKPLRSRSNAPSSYYYRFNLATSKVERFLNTLEFNFYINVETKIYDQLATEVLKSKASSDGVSNYNELIEALKYRDSVKLAPGEFIFPETFLVPSGKKIWGTKSTILKPGPGVSTLMYVTGYGQTLEGFIIDMGGATLDFDGATQITTADETLLPTPLNSGALIGIHVYEAQDVDIDNITVKNANLSGIVFEKTGDLGGSLTSPRFREGFNLTRYRAVNCYFGIRLINGCQYSRIDDVTCVQCIVGILVLYGNMAISNSHFTQCRVGKIIGPSGNDGHGNSIGCLYNHNTLWGIYITGLIYGYNVVGGQFFQGPICVKNSKGVKILGGQIGSEIVVEANLNQLVQIKELTFRDDGAANTGSITKTGVGKLLMAGNEWSGGQNSYILNGIF